MMKKSTFGAVLAFFFAAAGALTAAALYLYHREKELDEYERLLFSDDGDDYDDDDDLKTESLSRAPPCASGFSIATAYRRKLCANCCSGLLWSLPWSR